MWTTWVDPSDSVHWELVTTRIGDTAATGIAGSVAAGKAMEPAISVIRARRIAGRARSGRGNPTWTVSGQHSERTRTHGTGRKAGVGARGGKCVAPSGNIHPHPDPPPQGGREKDKGTGMLSEAVFEGGYEIGQRDPDLGHLLA